MALCQSKYICGFEHGDLHCYNAIVRRLEEPMVIHYTEIPVSITVKHLAVLIDYGYSSTDSIKPPLSIAVNDIYRLYASIITVLESKGMNYKNTPFYMYLVEVVKELKLEDWNSVDFDLISMEGNIRIPLTTNDIINEINKITQYTPDSFILEGFKSYIPNIHIEKYNKIDTTIYKIITPNIFMDNISNDNIICVNYWNNYANSIATILLLQDGFIDEYMSNARKILETLKNKYIFREIFREFFKDTLKIQ